MGDDDFLSLRVSHTGNDGAVFYEVSTISKPRNPLLGPIIRLLQQRFLRQSCQGMQDVLAAG